jgi:phage RecT family recombinase
MISSEWMRYNKHLKAKIMEKVAIFEKIEKRFTELVDEKTFKKECSFALQAFNKNPYLDKSTVESKLQAVLNVAQVGLSLNPVLGLGYLVPRYNGKTKAVDCHFMPGYQGLAKLATDTGSVISIESQVVYNGDEFRVLQGTSPQIHHEPKFESKEIKLVYAVGTLQGGSKMIEIMTIEDCYDIREHSDAYKAYKDESKPFIKSCIWVDHEGEMCRKTVSKRLCKRLPQTDKNEKLAHAIQLDNSEYDMPADFGLVSYAESLLRTCSIGEPERSNLESELMGEITTNGAYRMIEMLKQNQLDGIESGENYTQTDIHKKLDTK